MNYRIKYMEDTISDRDYVKAYLSKFYPGTAKRFFTLLKKRTNILKTYPESCPIYEDDPYYRKLVVGDYLVFYVLNDDEKVIEIHRILHGSMDIRQHLNRDR